MTAARDLAVALLVASVLSAPTSRARAQDASPCEPLFDTEVRARIAWIQARLDESETAGDWWFGTWLGLFSTAAVGQLVLSLAIQPEPGPEGTYWREFRDSSIVGTFTASLAVTSILLTPITAHTAPDALRALPESTPAERIEKLRAGERMLREGAQGVVESRQWYNFAQTAGVAIAASFVLHFAFDAASQIASTVATSVVAGSLRPFTAPDAVYFVWDRYRRAHPGVERCTQALAPRGSPGLAWSVVPTPFGLALRGEF